MNNARKPKTEAESASASASDLDDASVEATPASPFVAEVVDARHPFLSGRVLVRWANGQGAPRERWVPCVHALSVRAADRVLVTQASNWAEPIVTGVIDGFVERPEPAPRGPVVALLPDEQLRVTDAAGRPLVDVVPTDDGPVIRLLRADLNVEVEGKLRLAAKSLELIATAGEARVQARDDVVVRGETVHLN